MLIVPLQPIPNLTLQCQINGQACTISIVQMAYGLFMTLEVGSALIVSNVLMQNLNRIVRDAYLGFIGDFVIVDTQGTQNPDYTGLGGPNARYQLVYLAPTDLQNG
jgi:hypothetical protein